MKPPSSADEPVALILAALKQLEVQLQTTCYERAEQTEMTLAVLIKELEANFADDLRTVVSDHEARLLKLEGLIDND